MFLVWSRGMWWGYRSFLTADILTHKSHYAFTKQRCHGSNGQNIFKTVKAHMDCSFIMFPLPAKSACEVSAPASSQPHLSWLQQEPFPIWCAGTTFYGALCHYNDLCQNNHSSKGKVFEHGPFTSLQYKKKQWNWCKWRTAKDTIGPGTKCLSCSLLSQEVGPMKPT